MNKEKAARIIDTFLLNTIHDSSQFVNWDKLMFTWATLRYQVWKIAGTYPPDFELFIEQWKKSCFNAEKWEAFDTLMNAIVWFNSTQTPHPPVNR